MPIMHCNKCHHELEVVGYHDEVKCDWCGGDTHLLEGKTELEKMVDRFNNPIKVKRK